VIREQIATGGMATVHLGQLVGPAGFVRTVAVKRLGAALAEDPDAVAMLLDEARLTGRLHHPNVAATIDVVLEPHDACIIMEYVHGESLARLLRADGSARPSPAVVSSIVVGTLRGLHGAHEVCDEQGDPLEIIHRDVSPQNVIVGADGIPRLIDFGIAKARRRLQATTEGQLKGKLSYLAPEQIRGAAATRRTDVYAAGIVLWEALTGRRLFDGDCAGAITEQILVGWVDRPSKYVSELPEELDAVTLRALEADPARRFQTAAEMADALERAVPPAAPLQVAEWVQVTAGETLARRAELLRAMESAELPRIAGSPRRGVYGAVGAALFATVLVAGAVSIFVVRSSSADAVTEATAVPAPAIEGHQAQRNVELARDVDEATPGLSQGEAPGPPEQHVTVAPPTRRPPPSPASPRQSRARQQRASTPAAKDFCNPPYDVNEDGIRMYKRACL
jgi:serine/threonine-protein kinase